jgi:lipopolysaccharide/colanic/teichoic acid biosynthesis glycosyltransferase
MDQLQEIVLETHAVQLAVLDAGWQVCEESMREPLSRQTRTYLYLKRIMDFVIALITCILLLPIMALIAAAIKLDSRGPVLFIQERVGYDGATGEPKLIRVYKFRTMRYRADEAIHRAYVTALIRSNASALTGQASLKMARDPRITRVGRVLRKTSLDELPQLFNVLRGTMSLVGPRPAMAYEVAAYEAWHKGRLMALPGMTGWWQVMGRNRVSFDEMVCMDIYYIQHRSLALDLKILFLTPLAVVSTRGAG